MKQLLKNNNLLQSRISHQLLIQNVVWKWVILVKSQFSWRLTYFSGRCRAAKFCREACIRSWADPITKEGVQSPNRTPGDNTYSHSKLYREQRFIRWKTFIN